MFEVCTLFINRKKDIQSKEDERCSCAFVISVIRMGGVDETLLIKHFFVHLLHMGFYTRLILFLHKSECCEAALPGMRTNCPRLGLCRVPRRTEQALYGEQPFEKQSRASDYISQNGPSCPKPCLCGSDSTLFISLETEFQ